MDSSIANSYLGRIAVAAVGVWFVIWPYRRKYELDIELDRTARAVRWVVVLSGLVGVFLPGHAVRYIRVAWFIVSAGFLAWPNFAYHLTRLLRWGRVLSPARHPSPDGPTGTQG